MPSRAAVNRLGDRIRDHGLNDDDRAELLRYRASFLPAYERVVSLIGQALPGVKVTGRPEKTPDSIVAKLRRTKIEFARMQDIAGCRLVVELIRDQDDVVAKLSSLFTAARIVDRRAEPSFGYRAVHVIPTVDGRQVEIQVRTVPQDLWANVSERIADEFGAGLKYGVTPPGLDGVARFLDRSSTMIASVETSDTTELLNVEGLDRRSAMAGAIMAIMTLAMKESQ